MSNVLARFRECAKAVQEEFQDVMDGEAKMSAAVTLTGMCLNEEHAELHHKMAEEQREHEAEMQKKNAGMPAHVAAILRMVHGEDAKVEVTAPDQPKGD